MWCRAILATVALTCTLDTVVQAHGPTQIKDIVCVLILNGLQKEDLDVSTLRKLQRHNVNIDDMNNEELRKECEIVTRHASSQNDDQNTGPNVSPNISDKQDQKIKLSDSNLQNIIINYFSNVQKTSKYNDSEKIKNEEIVLTTDIPYVENFMNVWNMLNKNHDEESTTKAVERFTKQNLLKSSRSDDMRAGNKNIEYINKILQNFIATQSTTSRPITKPVNYDIIAQKIQEILANASNRNNPVPTQPTIEETFGTDKVNDQIESPHTDTIQYIGDIINFTNPFKMFGSVKENASNRNIYFEDKNARYQTEKRYLIDDLSPINIIASAPKEPQYKIHVNRQIQSLSEDIIREISENVRAKVLQDLKKVISTSSTTTTTIKPTEKTTTEIAKQENKEKVDAKDVLEKLMEMFQQFNANKDKNTAAITKNKANNKKKTKNTTQAKISLTNNNDIKDIPANITSFIISPFNPIHTPVIQTAIIPQEQLALLNINTPIQIEKEKPVHKITQLNIFNTKNNFHTSPITIQTNSVEVPPLGLPAAQQSVVYQNIVVTTKRPPHKTRQYVLHKTYTHDRNHYDNNNKYIKPVHPYPPPQFKDLHKEFDIRYERSRELTYDEYKDINRRKPIKYQDYGRSHYNDNVERFHEKLERADDWLRYREHRDDDEPKLITRHQLPLNDAKKRSRYDDAHFSNFLKTQQKVNDMLERILATKTMTGPRSVETTV